jgi:RimJ/RimL family protein N-acetyltransferase
MAAGIKIEAQRILLREYKSDASDLESTLKFVGDPEVAKNSSWGPLNRDEAVDWLKGAIAAKDILPRLSFGLALVVKSTDELIGHISLNIRNLVNKEAELGYTIRRDHWHQGFATEAARAVLGFSFTELGLHRIIANTSPHNIASQKVLEKLGFTREGYLRKNVLQRSQWRDSCLYAFLEDDWKSK